jgi:hypothetical protein
VIPATLTNDLAAVVEVLLGLIAKHGHIRRVPGPLVVLVWQRVRCIATQVAALLARIQAGTLRRYPHRRRPTPQSTRRRPPESPLPQGDAWLIALIQETAVSAAHLRQLLAHPDLPAQLQAAPQLRRALRPLCRMLGVRLPPPPAAPPASPPAPPRPPLPRPPASRPAAPQPDSGGTPAGRHHQPPAPVAA